MEKLRLAVLLMNGSYPPGLFMYRFSQNYYELESYKRLYGLHIPL